MTGKAKPKKHTAKEIQAKVDAATTNRGGGKAGLADRSGLEKGGHAKLECPHCKITAPDVKTMQIHHDAKHPKLPFDESKLSNLHATVVVETSSKPRPGVRGSLKKYEDVAMTGKAKPKKHTAKEIQAKVDAALTNRGGGKAGQADRSGIEKGGHAKLECPHCKITAPDLKTMQIHHDAKHPKVPFDEGKLSNLHATTSQVEASTGKPRPGVRGSLKK